MNYVLCDLETQSAVDLKKVGSGAYLRDPSTRLMSAVFLLDGKILVWAPRSRLPDVILIGDIPGARCITYMEECPEIIREAIQSGAVFVAHNADNFDAPAWKILVGGPQPEWYDTIHACRANGLPAGLDKASKALGGEGKDKTGSRSMQLLTKAKYVAGELKYPVGTAEVWKQLIEYNIQDVLELKRVFDRTGVTEPELLRVHRKINERGIPVDVPLARRLRELWDELGQQARDEVATLTNGELKEDDLNSPAKVKNWLARKGFPVASLARAQLEQMIADPDGYFGDADDEMSVLVQKVLLARQQSARTAPGKLDRIIQSEVDGRVKNCFVYHGAHTGRWSARDLQPHNFPRGLNGLDVGALLDTWDAGDLTLDHIRDAAYQASGSVADALATLMRPVIRAPKGRRLVICDYASVEARCVAWLARDEDMLSAFMGGRDIYCEMASTIFGRPVTKADKTARQVGKNTVLGCGYQMGAKKFSASALLQGCNLDAAGVTGEQCVRAFRGQFRAVPRMWKAYDTAFRKCVGGYSGKACRVTFSRDGKDVVITLPSGRKLRYRDVDIEMRVPLWGGDAVPTPTYASPHGFRKVAYGGYLTENISQATCRDLLAHAMMELEGSGQGVIMHVHDEVVCEALEGDAPMMLRHMLEVMSSPPEWASGFPLAVEGFVSEHYVKSPLPGYPQGKGELGEVQCTQK